MIRKQLYETPEIIVVGLKTKSCVLTVLSGNAPDQITNVIGGEEGEDW